MVMLVKLLDNHALQFAVMAYIYLEKSVKMEIRKMAMAAPRIVP